MRLRTILNILAYRLNPDNCAPQGPEERPLSLAIITKGLPPG